MTRAVQAVSDMEIDEVSLVDRPANQHAAMVIAKSFQGAAVTQPQYEEIPVYLQDGTPVDENTVLAEGDLVYGEDGTPYRWTPEDDEAAGAAVEDEAAVAKGTAFQPAAGQGATVIGKSLAETFQEEIAKAKTGADVSAVISKMSSALAEADARASNAETIAKAEQDLRLTREFIAKAGEYNLPVAPDELGPVLKRCDELLPYADCVVLDRLFKAAGHMLFTEVGFQGGGTPAGEDPMAEAEAAAGELVTKAAGSRGGTLSKAQGVEAYFAANPAAYDEYLRTRG